MRRLTSSAGDLRLCPSAHAASLGRATTQLVSVGMHRICAAVCETARLAHWRRNLASNPLVVRKQETLFRRAFFDRFGLRTASLRSEGDRAFESRSLRWRVRPQGGEALGVGQRLSPITAN
jgi:hypothetical protein